MECRPTSLLFGLLISSACFWRFLYIGITLDNRGCSVIFLYALRFCVMLIFCIIFVSIRIFTIGFCTRWIRGTIVMVCLSGSSVIFIRRRFRDFAPLRAT